ncbi:arabinan endo-1,5-alpha-L-arabinosidase [Sphingomonas sanguinis]|uniref:arabinan endo-1,5-alpha-L-arabinosidase n=1 Tax=Sphingomonas sanguinis TaxID=33051 RepID=UPI001C592712|nr:arabinan endo-1,5-alpha-L-arabinosidase [Sphingomonas sanguinis]QXT35601.1 arabinan endo-1,5-alpha-L-arabinosidase [Sphingomonas sanguinis]
MRQLGRSRSLYALRVMLLGATLWLALAALGLAPDEMVLSGDVMPAHDPVLIREGDRYYAFSTGQRDRRPLVARTSRNLRHWSPLPSPLPDLPDWAKAAVPGAREMWAPDIARVGGRYRLYYSVSRFGSQHSAIGLATATTLDPDAPGHGWHDEGLVIASRKGDPYNAIDPAFARDRQGGEWLAFGSFWGGIQLVRLDPRSGKPAAGARPVMIARRGAEDKADAIEAPFIIDHGGWYWLIVSFDYCCRGAKSNYHLRIGRARSIEGPYVDRAGRAMRAGGGTVLLQADAAGRDRFRGPGHAGVLHDRDGRDYLIYHAYDAAAGGAATLRVARLHWNEAGWPFVEPDEARR